MPAESPAAQPAAAPNVAPRRFDFACDTFAFANELFWEYQPDSATGRMNFRRREPPPKYAHRCFVLARAARQFFYHARFDASQPLSDDAAYSRLVRAVLGCNPRRQSHPAKRIVLPGFASLRAFSEAKPDLLRATCGGAWRSYVLRSHWRMVFPISRRHQAATAAQLLGGLVTGDVPVVHLVRFPQLTINHGIVLFNARETETAIEFAAYDPNRPGQPARLEFDRATRTFQFPANHYWAGGRVDVIEIFRGWLY